MAERTPEEHLRFDQFRDVVNRILYGWCEDHKVTPHEMVQIFHMGIAAWDAHRQIVANPDETLLAMEEVFKNRTGIYADLPRT